MDEASILIVENDPVWQRELIREVSRACPESPVRVPSAPEQVARELANRRAGVGRPVCITLASSFPEAEQRLADSSRWDLVITDIALTDANDDKLGKSLARQLRSRTPYMFVSNSEVVDTDDVRELLIDEQALDYFNKEKFHAGRFEGLVRQILFAPTEPDPDPSSSAGRRIEIGWGADSYTLAREGQQQVTSLPAKFRFLFECFGRKIASNAPGEEVTLRELNLIVDREPGTVEVGEKASGQLRKTISNLNRFLQTALGVAPNGERWIESSRTSGYALNDAGVDWVITDAKKRKELARASQSVGAIIIEGYTMQNNTSAG